MDDIKLPAGCIKVEGPAELANALDELLSQSLADKEFSHDAHYVFYQLGQQQALIKIDMSEKPFQFWYGDLLGRPATRAVKETIAKFLTNKCGETDLFIEVEEQEQGE
jgi:hypothetical protein